MVTLRDALVQGILTSAVKAPPARLPLLPSQLLLPVIASGSKCGLIVIDTLEIYKAYHCAIWQADKDASNSRRLFRAAVVTEEASDRWAEALIYLPYILTCAFVGSVGSAPGAVLGGNSTAAALDISARIKADVAKLAEAGRVCAICGTWFTRTLPAQRVTCKRPGCTKTYEAVSQKSRRRKGHADATRRNREAKKLREFIKPLAKAVVLRPLPQTGVLKDCRSPEALWQAIMTAEKKALPSFLDALTPWLEQAANDATVAIEHAMRFARSPRRKRAQAKNP